MCGIIGFFSKDENSFIQPSILSKLTIRGEDGLGCCFFSEKDGELKTIRQTSSTTYISDIVSFVTNERAYKMLVGNSRAIPTTEMQQGASFDVENQQPFMNEDWIVVHNGGISNDLDLRKKYKIQTTSKVDSSILPGLFSKVGIIDGLRLINGSYAICAYERKKNVFWFGSNFMPLVYGKVGTDIYVTSLREMLPNFVENVINCPPYTLFRYDGNKLESFSLYREEPNKKVLVICSGGIDSVTTAYLYKHYGYEVSLLHFDYGHAAQEAESWSVKKIAKHLGARLIVYDATPIFKGFKKHSLLLSQKKPDSSKQLLDAESTLSYVPNRNMIFASIAAGIAEVNGISKVALGAQQMDGIAYPDNNVPFIESIDTSFKYALNWYKNISFRAPLIHLIKHEIISLGLSLGVPYEYVCSCYYPKIKNNKLYACGECGCCQFRLLAFKMLGVKDPANFLKDPVGEVEPIKVNVNFNDRVLPYM